MKVHSSHLCALFRLRYPGTVSPCLSRSFVLESYVELTWAGHEDDTGSLNSESALFTLQLNVETVCSNYETFWDVDQNVS